MKMMTNNFPSISKKYFAISKICLPISVNTIDLLPVDQTKLTVGSFLRFDTTIPS